jgi:hypothetical protein
MKVDRIFKLITAIAETYLAIPVIGGLSVVALLWVPLAVMLVLHVITLVVSSNKKSSTSGSILGIVTSILAFIPILGWILHITTAIVLWITFATE